MKKPLRLLLALLLWLPLPGCMDRIDLEDATLSLMIGMDLNPKNELLFYLSSPIFSREAKEKSEEYGVRAEALRQSRARFDEMVTGLTLSGKTQLFVIGTRLLETPDWFRLLDVVFRDARFSVNAKMIVYDGPVHDLFRKPPPTKPRLAMHLTKLVDTANRRNITVKTTVEELHRQMYEKGMTPSLTKLAKAKGNVIRVMGTALLKEEGSLATVISGKESVYLQMLLHGKRGELSVSIPYPDEDKEGEKKKQVVKKRLSFFVKGISKKVKVSHDQGRFQIDVDMDIRVSISERLFPFDMEKDYKKMEKKIEEEMGKEFQQLVQKCQKQQIDPFGFGLYARAYQYPEWKKVENDWPHAFANAAIRIVPHVSIKGNGLVK